MDLDVFERYQRYLQTEKRYSLLTLSAYQQDLGDFVQWLEQLKPAPEVVQVKAFHIRDWISALRRRGLGGGVYSVNFHHCAVFINFCCVKI